MAPSRRDFEPWYSLSRKINNSMTEEEESVAGRRGDSVPVSFLLPPGGLTSCHLPLPLKPVQVCRDEHRLQWSRMLLLPEDTAGST